MDKFTAMTHYCRVVEHGGFAAAARQLDVTRSTVSKQIIALEEDLGVALLNRSTRVVSPTDAGLRFYQRASAILDSIEAAEAEVSIGREVPTGRLRVNAPLPFGELHLGQYVCDFVNAYPDVEVELNLSDRFIDLLNEDYDLTIRIAEPVEESTLVVKEICPVRIVLCAAPSYLDDHGTPQTPDDLAKHQCLHFGHHRTGRQWLLGNRRITPTGRLCTNNATILHQAARAGRGIVGLPTFIVGPDLKAGVLRTVLPDHAIPARSLQAIYPFHRQVASKVTVFINGLIDRFAEAPPWQDDV
ncbi:MAG: LysR family transcriptional regulator [Xanthomonadales bacterium]|jgi:DNA-binding transcriptional LysR family regulator|nr:LysR family transcriptional regulator [Xanthomonadales bacterium]